MKKFLILLCIPIVFAHFCFAENNKSEEAETTDELVSESVENSDNDFLPLTNNIKREINGAFIGLGATFAKITNKVSLKNSATPAITNNIKDNNVQPMLSLIAGFGGNFYKRYYAGIDIELSKRFSNKEKGKTHIGDNALNDIESGGKVILKQKYDCDAAVVFDTYTGLNMDVRLGYQLQNGVLPYLTFGFSKENGKVSLYDHATGNRLATESYGSFHPTLGLGIERQLNYRWNVRCDFRISIPSTDTGKRFYGFSQRAKTSKVSFRLSLTRNI